MQFLDQAALLHDDQAGATMILADTFHLVSRSAAFRCGFVAFAALLAGYPLALASLHPASPTLDDVRQERTLLAHERLEDFLHRYAAFFDELRPGVPLPKTQVTAWLDPGSWLQEFAECSSEASGLSVRVDPAIGVTPDPTIRQDAQLLAWELAIFKCHGELPPPDFALGAPGPIETEWSERYAGIELPACLRRQGVFTPSRSAHPSSLSSGPDGSDLPTFAAAVAQGVNVVAARARCPSLSDVLANITPSTKQREPLGRA